MPDEIDWICPDCDTLNSHNRDNDPSPACVECQRVFGWIDIIHNHVVVNTLD